MKLTFYDTKLQKKEIVFTWLSLFWNPMYNKMGSFIVEFAENSQIFGKIKQLDYVMFDEDPNKTVMMVWGIEKKGGKVIISGYDAMSLFEHRVSTDVISNVNAEVAMRGLVENMIAWESVTVGSLANIPDKFTAQTSDDNLLNYFFTISQFCDIGFRLKMNGRELQFECYKPGINRGTKFSSILGNMADERYSETEKQYKNVAVVAGADINGERVTIITGETESTGVNRREMYVDARDIQLEENEALSHYEERLIRRGNKKLAEQIKIQNTSFSLASSDVRLGDVVLITPTYINTTLEARISSVSFKSQDNKLVMSVGIGNPVPTNRR